MRANRTIRSDVDSNFWLEYVCLDDESWIFAYMYPGLPIFESIVPDAKTGKMPSPTPRLLPWSAVSEI